MKRLRPHLLGKRTLLVLLLVGGAIVNVAVAWGCAMYAAERPNTGPPEVGDSWWKDQTSVGHRVPIHKLIAAGIGLRVHAVWLEPPAGHSVWRDSPTHSNGWLFEAGCPMRSVEGQRWISYGFKSRTEALLTTIPMQWLGLKPVPRDRLAWVATGRYIPYCPIWPGFAINTIFYAAILWGVFAAPLALRRRRRIKRGLCPACAYPVGDSPVCTECGKPVTPRRGDGL